MNIQIILLIITTGICISCLTCKKKGFSKIEKLITKYYKPLFIVLLIMVIFNAFYKLTKIPGNINIDEAANAIDAVSLLKYGMDRHLNVLPIYLINFGGGQSALLAYLSSMWVAILGNKLISFRISLAIFRVFSFLAVYSISKELKNKLHGFLLMFIFAILPYFIMQSRFGLDCNLLVHFLIIGVALYIYGNTTKLTSYYLLSGIVFGLSFYSYILSSIIIPIMVFLLLLYSFYVKKITKKQAVCFLIPIIVFWIPYLLMYLVNKGYIAQIDGFITIPKLFYFRSDEISLGNVFKNIPRLCYLFIYDYTREVVYQNAIPKFGNLYYMSIPFLFIGFISVIKNTIKCIKKKIFDIDVIALIYFVANIICVLIIKNPNISKSNSISFVLLYFIAVGVYIVVKKSDIKILLIIIMYFISFTMFNIYYYNNYNRDNGNNNYYVNNDYTNVIKEIDKNYKDYKIVNIYSPERMASIYLFMYHNFNPYHMSRCSYSSCNDRHYINGKKYKFNYLFYDKYYLDNIPKEEIYVVYKYNQTQVSKLKKLGYKYKKVDYFYIFTPEKKDK